MQSCNYCFNNILENVSLCSNCGNNLILTSNKSTLYKFLYIIKNLFFNPILIFRSSKNIPTNITIFFYFISNLCTIIYLLLSNIFQVLFNDFGYFNIVPFNQLPTYIIKVMFYYNFYILLFTLILYLLNNYVKTFCRFRELFNLIIINITIVCSIIALTLILGLNVFFQRYIFIVLSLIFLTNFYAGYKTIYNKNVFINIIVIFTAFSFTNLLFNLIFNVFN